MSYGKQIDGNAMRGMMSALQDSFPGLGFIVLTYEFGDDKSLANYISNGNREDCVKFMRETANRIEKGTDYQTPNNN